MTLIGFFSPLSRTDVLRNLGEMLLISLMLLGPLAFGAVEPWAVAMVQGLILLLGGVAVLQCILSGEVPPMSVAALAGCVAFIGLLQATNVHAAAGVRNGFIFTTSFFYSTKLCFMWACYAILGASASWLLSRPAARIRFAWAIFVCGAIIAFVGIVQSAQGNTYFYGIRPIRTGIPFGPYTNYNHAAAFMSAALCIGLGIFLLPLVSERRPLGDHIARQVLNLAMLALIFFGILKTGSRAGLVSMFVGIGILAGGFALLGRWKIGTNYKWLLMVLAVAVISGLVFNPGGYRFTLAAIAHGIEFRGGIYMSCLSALLDFPIFGIGLGAVPAALHPYQIVWVGRLLETGHSDLLDILLQVGIVGGSLVACILLKLISNAIAMVKAEDSRGAVLRLSSLAACAVFFAHGTVESNLQIPANAALIFALLSWASTSIAPEPGRGLPDARGLRSSAFVVVSIGMFALLSVPSRAALGAWVFHHALARSGQESVDLLLLAVRLDSRPEYQYALARGYVREAEKDSLHRAPLQRALVVSSSALAAFPFHREYRALHAQILSILGRSRDAAAFPI